MKPDLITMGEAAHFLGIPYWRIVYAHQSGKIPEPTLRIGNSRVYRTADVRRLAEHFNITLNNSGDMQDEKKKNNL